MIFRIHCFEVQKVKRIVSVFVLIITLFMLVGGCSESNSNLRNYSDFIAEFYNLVSKLPDYTILQLNDVPLEDDSVCHVFSIKDTVLDETYRLRVNTNKNSEITWAYLSTERKTSGNLQFAVFSLYVYEAMGFSNVDADSFYDKYDLFSKEKIYVSNIYEGYKITSMTIDVTNEITFSIQLPNEQN
jgi:hypothetical protein